MDMGMMLELLSPSVEHTEESNLGTQVLGIAGNLDQGFSAQTHQQRVDELLVLQRKLCQETRHRENDVGIGYGENLSPSPLDPTHTGIGLTFGAMPVTA